MKKTILIAIAILLAFSILSGCVSKPNNTGSTAVGNIDNSSIGDTGGLKLPITDKPVTLKIMVATSDQNLSEKFVYKELQRRTGVKLEIENVTKESYMTRLNIYLASKKLPDILYNMSKGPGKQGAIIDFNQYIDQLPNFKKLMQENPWYQKSYSDEKGKLYWYPAVDVERDVNFGFMYRKDIFDKNDLKMWNNTEEFYQTLKKLKAIYPDCYPYSLSSADSIFKSWSAGWGLSCWVANNGPVFYDESDNSWKFMGYDPRFKEMLLFIKKLYNEGLIDPEFMTDSLDNWTSKMTVGNKAFVTSGWIGRMDMFFEQTKGANPNYDLRYANPVGPANTIRAKFRSPKPFYNVANNKNSLVSAKLCDYLISKSGAELMTMGKEGETYRKDATGKITYIGIDTPTPGIFDLQKQFGLFTQDGRYAKDSVYFRFSEREKEAQAMVSKSEINDPIINFNEKEEEFFQSTQPKVEKELLMFAAQFILDKNYDDAKWNEWVANFDKATQVNQLIDNYNAAQKRMN